MAESTALDDLLAQHRKEKKDLLAQTQKMKHGVPKGDKKKKKEVNTAITDMLAALELKHEQELKDINQGGNENVIESGSLDQNASNTEEPNKESTQTESIHSECQESESIKNPVQGAPRISKAQKRRNKKASHEKERQENIAAQELENLKGLRHLESEGIKKRLLERDLEIHEVPSDGNCLYKAVEHQLSSLNLQKRSVQMLREQTSEYMLSHMDDFIPFLTHPETGDVLTEEQYQKYCKDIINPSTWGGHIEVQALSQVCDVPIEIIQAEGPSIFAGNENCSPKLILSYHRHFYGLGEHYNSVVPTTG